MTISGWHKYIKVVANFDHLYWLLSRWRPDETYREIADLFQVLITFVFCCGIIDSLKPHDSALELSYLVSTSVSSRSKSLSPHSTPVLSHSTPLFSYSTPLFSYSNQQLLEGSPGSVVLDCDIVENDFEISLNYCIHFRINTLGNGMRSFIPPAFG